MPDNRHVHGNAQTTCTVIVIVIVESNMHCSGVEWSGFQKSAAVLQVSFKHTSHIKGIYTSAYYISHCCHTAMFLHDLVDLPFVDYQNVIVACLLEQRDHGHHLTLPHKAQC